MLCTDMNGVYYCVGGILWNMPCKVGNCVYWSLWEKRSAFTDGLNNVQIKCVLLSVLQPSWLEDARLLKGLIRSGNSLMCKRHNTTLSTQKPSKSKVAHVIYWRSHF